METITYEKLARREIDNFRRKYPQLTKEELGILFIVMGNVMIELNNK
jgi:hypothetical protein